jgi:hypothetical protein
MIGENKTHEKTQCFPLALFIPLESLSRLHYHNQDRSCDFRGQGESKSQGSIIFSHTYSKSLCKYDIAENWKNNHHRDKKYHRDQRIMGHITCTMVMDYRKNGGWMDWLSIGTGFTSYHILVDQLGCLWLLFPSPNQVCCARLSCSEVAYWSPSTFPHV